MSDRPATPFRQRVADDRDRRTISLRRIVRGDRVEFERLYRRHHQEIYRYCRAIVRNHEDAEDVLQATMAAALRSLPGERRDIALRPWLFRVAHNESISLIRGRAVSPDTAGAGEEQFVHSAEVEHGQQERLRELVADLRSLPERQRSALVMRELSGLSYAEIGTALTSSEGAARQAVHEARIALSDINEGREMRCEEVRRLISERDGRRLRGRRVRAHLRGCDGCTVFAAAIAQRRADLKALCPPLPAIASSAVLSGLLGGGATSSGAVVAAGAGGGLGASVSAKGAALIASASIAAGAADVSGVIDVPVVGGGSAPSSGPAQVTPVPGSAEPGGLSGAGVEVDGPADRSGDGGSPGRGHDHHPVNSGDALGHGDSPGGAPGHTGSPGNSGTAPGHAGSPGNSGTAPGHAGSPGNSGTAPGQVGAPGNSGTAPGQVGAPGNSGGAPGNAGDRGNSPNAPGPTGSSGAPGQTGSDPGAAPGNPGPPGDHDASPGEPAPPPGHADQPPGAPPPARGDRTLGRLVQPPVEGRS